MLHELDIELENRGLRFVRYADDCIIFAKSQMAAKRIMRSTTRFIEGKLGLIVNADKSKVTNPNHTYFKFLGFGFYKDYYAKQYKAKPHHKLVERFKYKLKQLTKRSWSINTKYRVGRINQVIRGWISYFKVGHMKKLLTIIDAHLRVRLRACI